MTIERRDGPNLHLIALFAVSIIAAVAITLLITRSGDDAGGNPTTAASITTAAETETIAPVPETTAQPVTQRDADVRYLNDVLADIDTTMQTFRPGLPSGQLDAAAALADAQEQERQALSFYNNPDQTCGLPEPAHVTNLAPMVMKTYLAPFREHLSMHHDPVLEVKQAYPEDTEIQDLYKLVLSELSEARNAIHLASEGYTVSDTDGASISWYFGCQRLAGG